MYLPRPRRSAAAVIVALLLLSGIEPNPGPAVETLQLGSLNVRSAIHKSALLHAMIADESLDLLALNETWAAADDPPAILQDIAPSGYHINHTPRPLSSVGHRGGGLAVIVSNRLTSCIVPVNTPTPTTFEVQCVRVTATRNTWTLVNIYRPPTSAPSTTFYNELADYLTEVSCIDSKPIVLCGDLNCPGVQSTAIASKLQVTLDSLNFIQHVTLPTRNNHILDILASNDTSLVTSISIVSSHHISDHSLIKALLHVSKPSASAIHRQYRQLHKIDFNLFDNALYTSQLINDPADTVDDYVRQINTVVINELDKVAPLKTVKRILKQLPCDAFLSTEARVAKRQRRRLERLWIRTGSEDVRRQ